MKARDIECAAVIGAGTMGAMIAGELARVGCRVRLVDLNHERLAAGMQRLRSAQQALRGAGRLGAREAAASLKRIEGFTCITRACQDIDLLVEAAAEDLKLKRALFRQCDRACPRRTVLVTNTSGLSITRIAAATRRPTKVAGMHFWNPPHLVPLVEVIKGRHTSAATARLVLALARRIGKQPVLVRRDVPGFIGNRLQFAVLREALHLVESGVATPADVDTAMRNGPGLRWAVTGPLRTADLGGLDVFHAISSYLFPELSARKTPSPALVRQVRQDRLGMKSGKGFYNYPPAVGRAVLERRDRLLLQLTQVLCREQDS